MEFIPKHINDALNRDLEHSAYEMAQMGKFSEYTIWVYGKEGPIPHFHFVSKDKEGCIQLNKNEYFSHTGKVAELSHLERKELIEFLQKPSNELPNVSNWQLLIATWNLNNPKYRIDTKTPMPNYRLIRGFKKNK